MRRTSFLSGLAAFASLFLLSACAGTSSPGTAEPVTASVGNAASRPALSGPPGCTKAIAEYEAIIDRDVTTGYLSQSVYDRINQDLVAGPRAACAGGRDSDARAQLVRVKNSHGYR
jgi:hypothetical protein